MPIRVLQSVELWVVINLNSHILLTVSSASCLIYCNLQYPILVRVPVSRVQPLGALRVLARKHRRGEARICHHHVGLGMIDKHDLDAGHDHAYFVRYHCLAGDQDRAPNFDAVPCVWPIYKEESQKEQSSNAINRVEIVPSKTSAVTI